jgi:hypothetical protein
MVPGGTISENPHNYPKILDLNQRSLMLEDASTAEARSPRLPVKERASGNPQTEEGRVSRIHRKT